MEAALVWASSPRAAGPCFLKPEGRSPSREAVRESLRKSGRTRVTVAEGESGWREEIVAQIPALRAFAWSLSHNSADADDLVQETLTKAWAHRDKYEPGTNLRAWLFTILRNTFYSSAARRRREVADADGKHAAALTTPPTQDWTVAMRALEAAMRQLPDEHREALVLVGAAGLTYEEAADICSCALGTIKSRVNRARARLLRIMEADSAVDALVAELAAPAGDP